MSALVFAFLAAFAVQIPADPDGPLEPSVMNEVEHALGRAPMCAATNAPAVFGDIFATNGLSATAIAVSLVSRQDKSGSWIVNGTNATSEAVAILSSFAAPLRVLMIGNSFSFSNLSEMPKVAAAMRRRLDLASLYIGGCSLARHWKNVVAASTNAACRPYRFDRIVDGRAVVAKGAANIPDALVMDRWDVVTVQQASPLSWRPETYEPSGGRLVAKIRELAPQARIVVQETWSYPTWDGRLEKFGFDQAEMYRRLHLAYASFAKRHGLAVLPVGAAAEMLPDRNSLFTAPDFHFNRDGKYLQGLVFTAMLFGVDVRNCAYKPDWMPAPRAAELRSSAMDAIAAQ